MNEAKGVHHHQGFLVSTRKYLDTRHPTTFEIPKLLLKIMTQEASEGPRAVVCAVGCLTSAARSVMFIELGRHKLPFAKYGVIASVQSTSNTTIPHLGPGAQSVTPMRSYLATVSAGSFPISRAARPLATWSFFRISKNHRHLRSS